MFSADDIMNTVKSYCFKNFENVEGNIFNIIQDNLDDKMVLIKFKRDDIPNAKENILLMEEDLYDIFKDIEFLYAMEVVDNIQLKMDMMERKVNYEKEARPYVNMFLTRMSLDRILEKDEKFQKYLETHCDDFSELLKYATIISSGWIRPKFDCIKTLLGNSF